MMLNPCALEQDGKGKDVVFDDYYDNSQWRIGDPGDADYGKEVELPTVSEDDDHDVCDDNSCGDFNMQCLQKVKVFHLDWAGLSRNESVALRQSWQQHLDPANGLTF